MDQHLKKVETAADIYKREFPRAPLHFVYADRMNKYVTDLDVWTQILKDEKYRCSIEKKAPRMIPWLIETYQKAVKSWREIETPPDKRPHNRPGPVLEEPVQLNKEISLSSALKGAPKNLQHDLLKEYEEGLAETLNSKWYKDRGLA